ncbi:MxaS protein [Bradyrhizobium sp. SK17]|jgi:uncharacterized protein (DUF58 family)|nr:DUF58 domain-containing protein [uncultured Bradyrhizobium sp.]AUC95610.1 MxaS protein [Bradyrhizobium sp. SK17]
MTDGPDIHYRPRGRISGLRAGAHPSRQVGSLGNFRDQIPFMAHPDARRIDVRATIRDPFENTIVRRYQQRASIDLYAIVDLTASLGYQGHARKMDLVTTLCASLARSATQSGDRFGLIGCDEGVRSECFIPAKRRRGVADDVADRLARASCRGASAEGLRQAADYLVGARKMVFVISDFLLPLPFLRQMFESIAQHDVISVLVGDSTEDIALPDWGLMEFSDLETGARRIAFMRPKLKREWIAREQARHAAVARLAAEFGRAPVMIADHLDIDRFSRSLMEA